VTETQLKPVARFVHIAALVRWQICRKKGLAALRELAHHRPTVLNLFFWSVTALIPRAGVPRNVTLLGGRDRQGGISRLRRLGIAVCVGEGYPLSSCGRSQTDLPYIAASIAQQQTPDGGLPAASG
jgi:hypothetical protein